MNTISHIVTSKGTLNVPLDYKNYLDKNLINYYQDIRLHLDNSIDSDNLYNVICKFGKKCIYQEPYYQSGRLHRRDVVLSVVDKGNYYYHSENYDMLNFFSPLVMMALLIVIILIYIRR